MKVITNDRMINPLLEGIVLQAMQDYVKSGRWLRANPDRRDPVTGELAQNYMQHKRNFEESKQFFEGNFFLSFIGGNRTAQASIIDKLNKTVDTPKVVMVGDKKVKITTEILNQRCKMLTQEIADCFIA